MTNPLACIEITSSVVRLLIGYEEDGKPVVLYTKEEPILGLVQNGKVVDQEGLVHVLESFHHIRDDAAKLMLTINEVSLVLPAINFGVHSISDSTQTVESNNSINKIDVTNVISMINKKAAGQSGDSDIVDVIPKEFILDNGRRVSSAPIGQQSRSLAINAMVHTLPNDIRKSYTDALTMAKFRLKRICVNSFCNALYVESDPNLPKNCFFVDIGTKITTISLISGGQTYGAVAFFDGGENLTSSISESFGLTMEVSEDLKRQYGYDARERAFKVSLAVAEEEGQAPRKIYQQDINNAIESRFETYSVLLKEMITKMELSGNGLDQLPIVFAGGGSQLKGLRLLLQSVFPGREMILCSPKVIGARSPRLTALLGLVLASGHYTGCLEDNHRNVVNVSREAPREEKKSRKNQSGFKDEL